MITEEKRIYCVVAQTVQTPFEGTMIHNPQTHSTKLYESINVIQPAGRIIAQAAHAISQARVLMLLNDLKISLHNNQLSPGYFENLTFEPITTIILGARDSYELYHVLNLVYKAGIKVHPFYDFNQPDYGDPTWRIMTAIATEPITQNDVIDILDYLPLWKPQISV